MAAQRWKRCGDGSVTELKVAQEPSGQKAIAIDGSTDAQAAATFSMHDIERAGGEVFAVADTWALGEGGGHARTPRTVCGDANRAQIYAAFVSPWTGWSLC
jgi:hypothetical protein